QIGGPGFRQGLAGRIARAFGAARARRKLDLARFDRLVALGKAACLPVAIVIVWGLVTETGRVPAYVLPSPRTVLATLLDFFFGGSSQAYSGKFLAHFLQSLYRVAAGFACGAALGIPLGIVLGYNRKIGAFIEPLIQLSRSIPGIC